MARPPTRFAVWVPAFSIFSVATIATLIAALISGLILGAGPATAQDTWMLFQKDERARRQPPAASDPSGLREGDRPLEPKGGSGGSERRPPAEAGYGDRPPAPPPRGAGPIAVERQELAPIAVPPPPPATVSPATPPSQRWDAVPRPAPRAPVPPPRESGFAPVPRGMPPVAPPGASPAAMRPSLDGIASLAPKALEDIVAGLELPSKSAGIAALWPQIWEAPTGDLPPAVEALRIETLRRTGAVDVLKSVLGRLPPPREPALAIAALRAHLLLGNRDAGCALAGEAIRNRNTLQANDRRDAVLAAGYCALAGGNADAGKLTADLIRGEGLDASFALAVLEGAGAGGKAPPPLPPSVGVLDYRLGEVVNLVWPSALVDRAEPAVLAIVTSASTIDPGLRIAAAERAARLHLLTPGALAEQYRGLPASPEDLANPLATRQTGAMRRAVLVQAIDAAASPDKKARLIDALLDDAEKGGLRPVVAALLAPTLDRLRPVPELAWFADSAAEVLVQGARGRAVSAWADLARDLDHWRVLGALADDGALPGSTGLASVERLARAGRMEAPRLHRLVTVLDALDVQITIPLWEAASRTPQPTDGHLPPTGVLAELKIASDKGEAGRVGLRVAQAMGPATAADVNLLALGDVIRALRKVGLSREARALAIEALIGNWPRASRR